MERKIKKEQRECTIREKKKMKVKR